MNPLAIAIIGLSFALGAIFVQGLWMERLKPILKAIETLSSGKTPSELPESNSKTGKIGKFLNMVAHSLKELKSAYQDQKRLRKEVNAAQVIQGELLPKTQPEFPTMQVFAKVQPASEIGGDAFDFYHPKPGKNLLYLGDSTGHGLPAGMIMIMVDTLLESFLDQSDDLKEILHKTNQYLKPHLKPTMFMTLILAEWNAEKSEFSWVGAGHEHVIHLHAHDQTVTATPTGGIALGMLPDNAAMLKQASVTLEANDWIVLFSDGITEAKNEKLGTFGLERLKEVVRNHASQNASPEQVFEKIISEVNTFMGSHPQEDDMSLVILKKMPN